MDVVHPADPGVAETLVEMELWRADRATSLIDLDSRGCVVASAPPQQQSWQEALYPPGLVLGAGAARLLGAPMSDLVPGLRLQHQLEACRNGKVFEVAHLGDQAPVRVAVQSSRKRMQPPGSRAVFSETATQLVVRAAEPLECGRPDFGAWILGGGGGSATPQTTATAGSAAQAAVVPHKRYYPVFGAPPDAPAPPQQQSAAPLRSSSFPAASEEGAADALIQDVEQIEAEDEGGGPAEPAAEGSAPELPGQVTAGGKASSRPAKANTKGGFASLNKRGASDYGVNEGGGDALDASNTMDLAMEPATGHQGGRTALGGSTGRADSDDGVGEVADDAFTPVIGKTNFQRGQRYKRLSRMLSGRVVTGMIRSVRNCGAALIVAAVVVQTVCFVVMLLLLTQQRAQVTNLSTAGKAARATAKLSNLFRHLQYLCTW